MKLKNTYILIIFLISASVLLLIIGLANSFMSQKGRVPTINHANISGRPSTSMPTHPDRIYVGGSSGKSLQRLFQRKPLSPSDSLLKAKITNNFEGQSGTPYSTNAFAVNYVQGPDDFEVEITTKNLAQAKSEALRWFQDQGFSPEGICNLPVSFYIIDIVKNFLPASTTFDPNPPGC